MSSKMRPFNERIAVLEGEIASLVQGHMAEVTGIKIGGEIQLRDGRKAVVSSFVNFLPLVSRDRLPTREEVGLRLRVMESDGSPGRIFLVVSASNVVTSGAGSLVST